MRAQPGHLAPARSARQQRTRKGWPGEHVRHAERVADDALMRALDRRRTTAETPANPLQRTLQRAKHAAIDRRLGEALASPGREGKRRLRTRRHTVADRDRRHGFVTAHTGDVNMAAVVPYPGASTSTAGATAP